jgi:hypothetical protein
VTPGPPLLADLAIGELDGDVEVADVTRVLLQQVEQDPLKSRRIAPVPTVARLAEVSKVMGFDDGPGPRRLGLQCRDQLWERLLRIDVPAAVTAVTAVGRQRIST